MFFLSFLADVGSFLVSLKGLLVSYLVPYLFKTLHCYEDFPFLLIVQVGFDTENLHTFACACLHICLRLLAHLSIPEYFFDKADTPLIFLMWSSRLSYAIVFFIRGLYNTFIKSFRNFMCSNIFTDFSINTFAVRPLTYHFLLHQFGIMFRVSYSILCHQSYHLHLLWRRKPSLH